MIGRACMFLECAHFVSKCNRGEWPNWMKLNLPGFRQVRVCIIYLYSGYVAPD